MTLLEDRLREYYHDEAAGLEPPDLLPGVLTAGRRARRRARVGAVALAAAVVVLVAGSAELSLRAEVGPALHRAASEPFTVATRTDLHGWGPPSEMVAVPGGVWLASWDQGALVRIDAATGRITARVPVGQPQSGPYSIAYGAGSLWVVNFGAGDLLRLNPVTGQVIRKIPVVDRYVTVGGGFVWATTFGSSGPDWNHLVKIDPATGRVIGHMTIPGSDGPGGARVAATGAAVWVQLNGASIVRTVDPARMRFSAQAQTGGVQGLAPAGRRLWVLTYGGRLERIDPPWSAVTGSARVPQLQEGTTSTVAGNIAASPYGTVWAGGQALYQVSQASMRVRTISQFGAVDNVSALGSTLWVQADGGSVYQLVFPQSSPVPNVVMMPVAAAQQLLRQDGYTVKVTREAGLEPLGVVIYQHPAAGTRVPRGSQVTLVTSAGPATRSASP